MPGRKAKWGEAQQWLRDAAASETDECLLWPFATAGTSKPRAVLGVAGRSRQATNRVLELCGRSLAADEQANHTCDRPLCCNPRHLYAGSQHENVRDAINRGLMKGLSDEVVEEIHHLSSHMSYRSIASHLGVTYYAARYHARDARRAAI